MHFVLNGPYYDCSEMWSIAWMRKVYSVVVVTFTYAVPVIILTVCYGFIGRLLRKTTTATGAAAAEGGGGGSEKQTNTNTNYNKNVKTNINLVVIKNTCDVVEQNNRQNTARTTGSPVNAAAVANGTTTIQIHKNSSSPYLMHSANKTGNGLQQQQRQRKIGSRGITMTIVLVAAFSVCWLPLHTILLLHEFAPGVLGLDEVTLRAADYMEHERLINRAQWVFLTAHIIAMLSACTNPVTYSFMSQRFRSDLIMILRLVTHCRFQQRVTRPLVSLWYRLRTCCTSAFFSDDADSSYGEGSSAGGRSQTYHAQQYHQQQQHHPFHHHHHHHHHRAAGGGGDGYSLSPSQKQQQSRCRSTSAARNQYYYHHCGGSRNSEQNNNNHRSFRRLNVLTGNGDAAKVGGNVANGGGGGSPWSRGSTIASGASAQFLRHMARRQKLYYNNGNNNNNNNSNSQNNNSNTNNSSNSNNNHSNGSAPGTLTNLNNGAVLHAAAGLRRDHYHHEAAMMSGSHSSIHHHEPIIVSDNANNNSQQRHRFWEQQPMLWHPLLNQSRLMNGGGGGESWNSHSNNNTTQPQNEQPPRANSLRTASPAHGEPRVQQSLSDSKAPQSIYRMRGRQNQHARNTAANTVRRTNNNKKPTKHEHCISCSSTGSGPCQCSRMSITEGASLCGGGGGGRRCEDVRCRKCCSMSQNERTNSSSTHGVAVFIHPQSKISENRMSGTKNLANIKSHSSGMSGLCASSADVMQLGAASSSLTRNASSVPTGFANTPTIRVEDHDDKMVNVASDTNELNSIIPLADVTPSAAEQMDDITSIKKFRSYNNNSGLKNNIQKSNKDDSAFYAEEDSPTQ